MDNNEAQLVVGDSKNIQLRGSRFLGDLHDGCRGQRRRTPDLDMSSLTTW